MTERPTWALFGGSFDPPHIGHVLAAAYVLSHERVDRLLLIPVYQHPFAKSLQPFAHRMQMCELAAGILRGVEVSAIERELGGESLTLRTLTALEARHPDVRFRLVLGSDVLEDVDNWHQFDEIERRAPPIILGRFGHPHPRAPHPVVPEVSSRDVRRRLGQDAESARPLLSSSVFDYVTAHGLYQSGDQPGD